MEFDHPEIYAPVDLGVGGCRMVVASPVDDARAEDPAAGHLRVATKYPNVTRRQLAARGVQANVSLNGAMELAPGSGFAAALSIWLKQARPLWPTALSRLRRCPYLKPSCGQPHGMENPPA